MSDHCQDCESDRIASINAKCSDLCFVEIGENEVEGYVPTDLGIGGGDYVRFSYCLDCGKMQGDFPIPETEIEAGVEEDDDYEAEERWPSENEEDI